MKILLITDNYLPHVGGSRIYYHHLYSNMTDKCAVVLTNKTPGWKEFDQGQAFPIYRINFDLVSARIPFITSLMRYLVLFITALYLTVKHRINVIHCGEPEPAGVIGYLLHVLLGIPYMMYVHDDPEITGLRWYPKVMRCCYRNASGIIAACSQAKDNVVRYGVKSGRIMTIRTALERSFLNPADPYRIRRKHSLENKKVLLTVGRIVEEKGHEEVIKLLPAIIKRVPDTAYLIVGKGPDEGRLRKLAEKNGVRKDVIFAGFVPYDDLPSYYAASDLFIMLNKEKNGVSREGLGMVFLEASAQGKAVIGSTSGGTGDAVIQGETGYRIRISETEKLVSTITELLIDERKRCELGTNGRTYVLRNFDDWKSRAETLYRFTKTICNKRYEPQRGLSFEEKNPHPICN